MRLVATKRQTGLKNGIRPPAPAIFNLVAIRAHQQHGLLFSLKCLLMHLITISSAQTKPYYRNINHC